MPNDCGTFTNNNKNTNTKINFEIKMKGNIAKKKGVWEIWFFLFGCKRRFLPYGKPSFTKR